MNIYLKELTIREAGEDDARILCSWWNDGKVMEHAGFPLGLGTTEEEIKESLKKDSDEVGRRHIIELKGMPIGETNYTNMGNRTARIGIKICDESKQEKGYGSTILKAFIDSLFLYYGYERIILDTNIKNVRAQHVYEYILGFEKSGIRENSWKDQLGVEQSFFDFELSRERWEELEKDIPPYIRIRNEEPDDYFIVEELTRDAFWENSEHHPDEHLLTNRLRKSEYFVPELDFVAEVKGKIVGHIIYSTAHIEDTTGIKHEVLTFGPLSVLREFWYFGVGTALLRHSIMEARRLKYPAILIYGHPDYYPRVGFKRASEFGITTPSGNAPDPFMVLPLYEDALKDITGRFFINSIFDNLTKEDVYEFDKGFEKKDIYVPVPITVITDQLEPTAREAVLGLNITHIDSLRAKSEKDILSLPGVDYFVIETIKEVMREHHYHWGE